MAALGPALTLTGDLTADGRTLCVWFAGKGSDPGAPTPEP